MILVEAKQREYVTRTSPSPQHRSAYTHNIYILLDKYDRQKADSVNVTITCKPQVRNVKEMIPSIVRLRKSLNIFIKSIYRRITKA